MAIKRVTQIITCITFDGNVGIKTLSSAKSDPDAPRPYEALLLFECKEKPRAIGQPLTQGDVKPNTDTISLVFEDYRAIDLIIEQLYEMKAKLKPCQIRL